MDESGLYPITCLTTLTNKEKEQILMTGVVLCRNLGKNEELPAQTAISQTRISMDLTGIEALCKT